MTYERLIRYALWAALIAAFSFGAWHMASTIHDNIFEDGRLAERAEWQKKELDRQEELSRAVAEATKAIAADREKQVNSLIGAIENETQAKLDLDRELNAARAANRGLWISAKACRSNTDGSTGKTTDTGIESSTPNRIRLPEPIEQDLRELAADAQRVVIQYQTARRLVESCPQIEIIPDSEFHPKGQ